MRRDPFQAIADPTRRAIIQLIAPGPLNLNAVAGKFPISRPAISKHIKILTECGLILIHQKGRERFCEVNLAPLHEVSDWIDQYSRFWNRKLDALAGYLAEKPEKSNKTTRQPLSKKPVRRISGKKKRKK
ncbi:MAG TPA: metalloregulator ArsR/SmtB family transcription factor [Chitinophagaceae bacterium]|nr:metalloregulator ArsR/SmtB family transcription factor [Chitinophagaceae bacterium]